MRILVLDDSAPIRNAMGTVLRQAGYDDLVMKSRPDEAIDFVRSSQEHMFEKKIDVILMDLLMPDSDSIEALHKIRQNRDLTDIPVLMVSSDGETEKMERAMEAGVTDFIYRPLRPMELRSRVGTAARLKKETDKRKTFERELEALNFFLERANRELRQKSNHDGLTGVANRRYFAEILGREWRAAAREGNQISLIFCDLDEFKRYNEEYGHLEGDICLVKVADALEGALKRPADLLARYGGEEFAAVLPGTDSDGAMWVAEDMRKRLDNLGIDHNSCTSQNGKLSLSLGVATVAPHPQSEPWSLVEAADKALCDAKNQGRGKIQVGVVPLEIRP